LVTPQVSTELQRITKNLIDSSLGEVRCKSDADPQP
jgi:hypothetical protein